jgi:hypothetical protein
VKADEFDEHREGTFFVALADQESFRNGPTTPLNRQLIFNNKKFCTFSAKYRAPEKIAAREGFGLWSWRGTEPIQETAASQTIGRKRNPAERPD